MDARGQQDSRERLFLYGAVLLAIAYTAVLLTQIHDEVFFSGDAGVKALVVKQYAHGNVGVHLEMAAEPWVRELWSHGLYPFAPPFVYPDDTGYVVSFPFFFSVLSAPFYRLFGFRGLYVVPALSLWILWFRFASVLRTLKLSLASSLLALGTLVFATHLTLYGVMFWEHTLGAMLAFFGIELLATLDARTWTPARALAYGAICAMAFLVRSEALCLFAALGATSLLVLARRQARPCLYFVIGMALSAALIAWINLALYAHPLGAHSRQVLETFSLARRLRDAFGYSWRLLGNFVLHVPVALFVVVAVGWRAASTKRIELRAPGRLTLAALLFLVAVPLVAPNAGGKQIGPRYLVALAPLFAIVAGILADELRIDARQRVRAALSGLLMLTIVAGVYNNSHANQVELFDDYRTRVAPSLQAIRRDPRTIVAVKDTTIAQELEASFDSKVFFLTLKPRDLAAVASAALARGHTTFLYMTFVEERAPAQVAFAPGGSLEGVDIRHIGDFGAYAVYEAEPRASRPSRVMAPGAP